MHVCVCVRACVRVLACLRVCLSIPRESECTREIVLGLWMNPCVCVCMGVRVLRVRACCLFFLRLGLGLGYF